jgi:hypothetical protein
LVLFGLSQTNPPLGVSVNGAESPQSRYLNLPQYKRFKSDAINDDRRTDCWHLQHHRKYSADEQRSNCCVLSLYSKESRLFLAIWIPNKRSLHHQKTKRFLGQGRKFANVVFLRLKCIQNRMTRPLSDSRNCESLLSREACEFFFIERILIVFRSSINYTTTLGSITPFPLYSSTIKSNVVRQSIHQSVSESIQ